MVVFSAYEPCKSGIKKNSQSSTRTLLKKNGTQTEDKQNENTQNGITSFYFDDNTPVAYSELSKGL